MLLPSAVATAEAYGDPPAAVLLPEEHAVVAHSVASRRREFSTVRHCARQALSELGVGSPWPVLPGPGGAPVWPDGVVGSMTHTAGFRAAAVARSADILALGIDAEPHEPLDPDVRTAVTLPQEREMLAALAAAHPGTAWDRILFSAKESVYKAWYPVAGRMLEFEDALVDIDPRRARFRARLLVPDPPVSGVRLQSLSGMWCADAGLVATAVAVVNSPDEGRTRISRPGGPRRTAGPPEWPPRDPYAA
ncbi:4'-phosphopantetheinyl transferase [Streptomyces sp. AP-93]|uniref:4'-phosphopantetheinyl transferase family protein n=1 Tax=Streptomyces sp. AP-93 TaxID=2929048 RepID=UPI001FAF8EA9|nr:4'-phosphopantetheinyl transferase superfamily protein [Streptomyces sp. AP-93]MCJ0873070.1 4'-phosphopantetheinyl transferase superfamily protein [Streptomyces sp. AP-93]